MVRKTRKNKSKGIFSIPELRRSFEHIEEYVDNMIKSKESNEHAIKNLKKEWKRVFLTDLDKKSAEAFLKDRIPKHRKIRKISGGQAPIDYTMRPGIYIEPGQIPVNGQLPTQGAPFGSYIDYVSSGFKVPMPGQSYDPLLEQTRFPVATTLGQGTNMIGGKQSNKRSNKHTRKQSRKRGGSALLTKAFPHIPSDSPFNIVRDGSDIMNGKDVRTSAPYQL
jgi:hypothetical protein